MTKETKVEIKPLKGTFADVLFDALEDKPKETDWKEHFKAIMEIKEKTKQQTISKVLEIIEEHPVWSETYKLKIIKKINELKNK